MVGHMVVPGLGDGITPASLNNHAYGLLRNHHKFDGMAYTDDLTGMAAISNTMSIEQAVPKALAAGADQALWSSASDINAVIDACVHAVETGEIHPYRLQSGAQRVAHRLDSMQYRVTLMSVNKAGTGKKWAVVAGLLVGLLVILGVAYALDVVSGKGKLPRKTSVGGVDISRMEPQAAIDKLESELGGATAEPVTVTAGEETSQFIPEQAGMSLDFAAAVESIPEASMNPFARLAAFFGGPQEIDVDADVDPASLEPVLNRLTEELSVDATDGQVVSEEGEVNTVDAELGQTVDRGQLEDSVTRDWLDPSGVEVEPVEVEPVINQDKVDDFASGPAKAALSGPLELTGRNDVTASLDKAAISSFVGVQKKDDNLELVVDTAHAQELFDATLAETETEMQNAKISFVGGSLQVTS